MYWFDILEVLEKNRSEMDIYQIAEELASRGVDVNFNRLRAVLRKLYLHSSKVDRKLVKDGYKHKYVYFICKNI